MTKSATTATALTGLTMAGAGLGGIPAHAAATSWHVNQPNSTIIHGTNITSAILSVSVPPSISAVCPPGDASFSAHISGNGATGLPVHLGNVLHAKFGTNSPCSLAGVSITASLNDSVGVNASQPTTGGVTKGWIGQPRASGPASGNPNPISATLTGVNLACHLVVSGSSIPGSISNANGIFTINPGQSKTLRIKSVSGCLGLFTPGDPAGFFAQYSTSPQLSVTGP
jgi:hypothetical protein